MTEQDIIAACRAHGAQVVYQAAVAALTKPAPALHAMGLPVRGAADANRVMSVAFDLLSPEDRTADLADAIIGLAKLSSKP
jgi:hypothetical protein